MTFAEGVIVEYENFIGPIKFVGNSYVTICINSFPKEKQRDVCMIVYRSNFHKIKLLKESSK